MTITSIRRAFFPATLTTLVALMLSLLPASAQDAMTVDVRFPRGASGTTLSDTIEGYQTIDYRIGVSAGQTMSVQLDTNNSSNYFNISAPGASAQSRAIPPICASHPRAITPSAFT